MGPALIGFTGAVIFKITSRSINAQDNPVTSVGKRSSVLWWVNGVRISAPIANHNHGEDGVFEVGIWTGSTPFKQPVPFTCTQGTFQSGGKSACAGILSGGATAGRAKVEIRLRQLIGRDLPQN